MSEMLLAVPVLLPVFGGIGILAGNNRNNARLAEGKTGSRGFGDRSLAWLVEGLVILNSLVIGWLIVRQMGGMAGFTGAAGVAGGAGFGGETDLAGEADRLVLFRLYGNLSVMFKLDRMGSVFAGLVALLWPLATLYALEYMRKEARKVTFFAYYIMTYGVTAGIALAGNLVTMYLFYEMLTLVTFPLVLFPLTKEAVRASRKYLYYSIGGAAFAFIGLVFVLGYSATGNTEFLPGGVLNLTAAEGSRNVLLLVYVLAFFGFGVKAALVPCHGWLPRATVAPTPVTALLHAVAVVKSGAFAILRFTYYSYGTAFLRGSWAQWVVMGAALVSIVYGSTMAVREIRWKRRLAYSTISNLSYILFGAAMMTPLGLAAALSHMVAHAFMKICSFFCAGAVMHETGKTNVYELDGLGRRMPVTFGCLTVASLSLMGIPLFAGFISKWNLARGAFGCGELLLAQGSGGGSWLPVAGVAVILYSALMTGIYMLTVLVRAYFPGNGCGGISAEELSEKNIPAQNIPGQNIPAQNISGPGDRCERCDRCDPNWMMLLPLLIFAVAIVALGVDFAPLMRFLTVIGGEAG